MLTSLLLTSFVVTATPPSLGLATMPRREGTAPPSTLIRVNAALEKQLQQAGVITKQLSAAQRRTLQACSLSATCMAGVAKGAGVEVVVRANVTVFPDNVALVLTAVSAKRVAIVSEEAFGLAPGRIEEELKERSARFVSQVASAAGASETPPVEPPPPPPPPPSVAANPPSSVVPPPPPAPTPPPGAATAELKSEPRPELLPPPPPPEPMVHLEARPSWTRTLGWSFTVAAGASAIASAVFLGLGIDHKSQYDSSLVTVGGVTASRLPQGTANDLASRGNNDLTLGFSFLAAAVAFGAAALIFFLTG